MKSTLLLITHDESLSKDLVLSLESRGYAVTAANSCTGALGLLREGHSFSAVLLGNEFSSGLNCSLNAVDLAVIQKLPFIIIVSKLKGDLSEIIDRVPCYGIVSAGSEIELIDAMIQLAIRRFAQRGGAALDGDTLAPEELNKELSELRIRNMFLDGIANSVFDGILVIDGSGQKIFQNQRAVEIWKLPRPVTDDPDGMKQVRHILEMTKDPQQFMEKIEYQKIHPDDSTRDELELKDGTVLDRHSAPVIGMDGRNYGRIYTFHDITKRKLAADRIRQLLDEKETLLKEIHHRMKNNMNTVASLLSLQADTLSDESAIQALNDAKRRVQSMMILYNKLYESTNYNEMSVRAYLTPLIELIVDNFPNRNAVKVRTDIDEFVLSTKKIQPLGIIINELITNIMKYAFAGRKEGSVSVSAKLDGDRVTAVVEDDGRGLPESGELSGSGGFGLMLVQGLIMQIGGEIRFERGKGTRVVIEFDSEISKGSADKAD